MHSNSVAATTAWDYRDALACAARCCYNSCKLRTCGMRCATNSICASGSPSEPFDARRTVVCDVMVVCSTCVGVLEYMETQYISRACVYRGRGIIRKPSLLTLIHIGIQNFTENKTEYTFENRNARTRRQLRSTTTKLLTA